MSEPFNDPREADRMRYERPNHNWICGHTCEGCPCRIGPGNNGECRATFECQPMRLKKDGVEMPIWQCTRPAEWGGKCEVGPSPNGQCCKAIARCQPVRSLRARRGLLVLATVAASVGSLLLILGSTRRSDFLNPAPLSSLHHGPAFDAHAKAAGSAEGCAACHGSVANEPSQWIPAALGAAKKSLAFEKMVEPHPKDFSKMDASCMTCHETQGFHVANLVNPTSCSICHREHQGPGAISKAGGLQCTQCHGNQEEMAASAAKGRTLNAAMFAKPPLPGGQRAFPHERPADGYTQVITDFGHGHPEFQIVRETLRDPNPLRFNHAVHLSGDIPPLAGKPLDCASCHQLDASRAFFRPVSYQQNCQSCHTLQFDERTPGLTLPHGDPISVRAFLRSLPAQYTAHAMQQEKITGRDRLESYVTGKMAALRERSPTGEALEQAVFFSDGRTGPTLGFGGRPSGGRASFAGCAYCHTVTPQSEAAPLIAKPVTPHRWMTGAHFDHTPHATMKCTDCHDAGASQASSDVIMPSQQSCVECHSPKGGVRTSCTTCHDYHRTPPTSMGSAKLAELLKP